LPHSLRKFAKVASPLYHQAMQRRTTSVNVVSKAVHVLKACQTLGPGLSLGDIASYVKLPRSTVQRLVRTLVEEGFLSNNGTARSIRLGPDILAIGATAATNIVEKVQPILRRIAAETGETVDLSRFNVDHMVFVNQIAGSHRLRSISAVGDTFPLHCTANGKAVLAQWTSREMRHFCMRELKKYTPKTLTQTRELEQHLKQIRNTGVAQDIEEHSIGICAVGIAIKDAANQYFSVSIPVPTVRFYESRTRCEAALHRAAGSLQSILS
jgi:DNA-binding IclR family transcriptional regulator